VLDEPTNDLDMETLEVLEQRLIDYNGTLIIVSHDRQFLDNVVTSTIVFEQQGEVREYVGGYTDWLRQGKALAEVDNPDREPVGEATHSAMPAGPKPKKPGYNEQRELDELPQQIEQLEKKVAALLGKISDSDFYSQDHVATQPVLQEFAALQQALDDALERWTELEDQQQEYDTSRSLPSGREILD